MHCYHFVHLSCKPNSKNKLDGAGKIWNWHLVQLTSASSSDFGCWSYSTGLCLEVTVDIMQLKHRSRKA